MGFFSSLFNIEIPHRMFGMMAKDICVSQALSDKDISIIKKLNLDDNRFISARNTLLITIFNLFYIFCEKHTSGNPNSTVSISRVFFQERLREYYDSMSELEQLKMQDIRSSINTYAVLEDSAKYFYLRAAELEFDSLSYELQNELKEFVNVYVKEVEEFFKKNLPKLTKPL